jgi:hypothetical protein
MVQSQKNQDRAGTSVVPNQSQEISNLESENNQRRDVHEVDNPSSCINLHFQITMN